MMKTIEELAIECNLGVLVSYDENENRVFERAIGNECELEALCKAYMQDRLGALEPVVWQWSHISNVTKEQLAFGHSLNKVQETNNAFWNNPPNTVSTKVTELFDISSLKDKP